MAEDDETPEIDETPEDDAKPRVRPTAAGANPLSRDTDQAARPGFRNPSNARSKAQKKKKKGRK